MLSVHKLLGEQLKLNALLMKSREIKRIFAKQELCSMERVSAQCMLFPTPVSKRAQFKVTRGQSS